MYDRVLVTGGSGFIGTAMKKYKPNWIYMSSTDCDITDKDRFYDFLMDTKPDAIIHLAARVGGIKDSVNNQAEFLYLNNLININVIHQAYRAGITRVMSCLSTCCFPDVCDSYPMNEGHLMIGEPTETNYGYAYAKRILFLQSKYYSECYGVNYNCFTPSNIYGPNNSFDNDTSHFISSMIKKFCNSKDGDVLTFWGTGAPLRQHLYVDDLAEIITLLLPVHHGSLPIVVAPDENYSIKEHLEICKRVKNKDVKIGFNGLLDGQYRKDASNKELKKLIGEYKFTSLEDGLLQTALWYKKWRTNE